MMVSHLLLGVLREGSEFLEEDDSLEHLTDELLLLLSFARH